MKIGNLRLDQKYTFKEFKAMGEVTTTCDNCGALLKNLYTIEGEKDKELYIVGSECVEAYTLMNPLEYAELKRTRAKHLRFVKELRKAKVILINEHDNYWFYTSDNPESPIIKKVLSGKWDSNWRGRGIYEGEIKDIIDGMDCPKVREVKECVA